MPIKPFAPIKMGHLGHILDQSDVFYRATVCTRLEFFIDVIVITLCSTCHILFSGVSVAAVRYDTIGLDCVMAVLYAC